MTFSNLHQGLFTIKVENDFILGTKINNEYFFIDPYASIWNGIQTSMEQKMITALLMPYYDSQALNYVFIPETPLLTRCNQFWSICKKCDGFETTYKDEEIADFYGRDLEKAKEEDILFNQSILRKAQTITGYGFDAATVSFRQMAAIKTLDATINESDINNIPLRFYHHIFSNLQYAHNEIKDLDWNERMQIKGLEKMKKIQRFPGGITGNSILAQIDTKLRLLHLKAEDYDKIKNEFGNFKTKNELLTQIVDAPVAFRSRKLRNMASKESMKQHENRKIYYKNLIEEYSKNPPKKDAKNITSSIEKKNKNISSNNTIGSRKIDSKINFDKIKVGKEMNNTKEYKKTREFNEFKRDYGLNIVDALKLFDNREQYAKSHEKRTKYESKRSYLTRTRKNDLKKEENKNEMFIQDYKSIKCPYYMTSSDNFGSFCYVSATTSEWEIIERIKYENVRTTTRSTFEKVSINNQIISLVPTTGQRRVARTFENGNEIYI